MISESKWYGRSLLNYKTQQESLAKRKGLTKELVNVKTLTEARKLLYGTKKGSEPKTKKVRKF